MREKRKPYGTPFERSFAGEGKAASRDENRRFLCKLVVQMVTSLYEFPYRKLSNLSSLVMTCKHLFR